ncbi:aminopeptidase P family protein [Candidatus Poriferisocius sp.]|uniref:aminopeptidase P family protein n=1 Tax=Candidatus Poriferisocius sp. TaxID=3101276 RepID=UPI003B5BF9D3
MSLHLRRRQRTVDALSTAGIDLLVCGRQDNVNDITGAHQLWTAGTRLPAPICTLNTATGELFLLSTWDEGIPDDIDIHHLHGITWNGATMARRLAATPGMADARRVGIDAWSPGMARLIGSIAPRAEVIPVDDLLARARRIKLAPEVAAIRAACAVAAAAVAAARQHPGDDHQRLAAGLEAMARAGSSTPATAPRVQGPLVDFGCIRSHYEGGLGRTAPPTAPGAAPEERPHADLIAACLPGASGEDLRRAAPDGQWLVRGCGLGFEPPVINPRHGAAELIEPHMVLSVSALVGEEYARDTVLITEHGPEIISPELP